MTFDEAIAGGEALLKESILQETQETLQLDFKGSAVGKPGALFTSDGKLTKDGRRSISKALSAFSNSAGGVVVIGVDCRVNSDGVDAAQALDPVANWKAALSAVSSAVGDLPQPKNDGVRVAGFPSARDSSAGYLVIEVPRSERRPHMCSMTKQYFKRSGSASYAMEHFDIEDSFRRMTLPALILEHAVTSGMSSPAWRKYRIAFSLRNTGSVSAFYPSLSLTKIEGIQYSIDDRNDNVYLVRTMEGTIAYGKSDFVIHPGSTREILSLGFQADLARGAIAVVGGKEPYMAYLSFLYAIAAKDMRLVNSEIEIPLNTLRP